MAEECQFFPFQLFPFQLTALVDIDIKERAGPEQRDGSSLVDGYNPFLLGHFNT